MKKILLINLLSLSGLTLNSQITISETDFSDGGDTVRISLATNPSIDYSSTGANYVWDFTDLIPESQELLNYQDLSNASMVVNVVYGTFAAQNYRATNFKESNALPLDQIGSFLPVNISAVNEYSKNATDSVTSVGMSAVIDGTEIPFKSDTIETRYKLPLNYLDSYSSRGYTNLDMNPIYDAIWRQYRTRNSIVDGWGSVSTPFGTFDALRVVHTIDETDSLYITFSGIGYWVELPIPQTRLYEWLSNGEKEPVLRITTRMVGGSGSVSSIEYRDQYRNIETSLDKTEMLDEIVEIYPNPVIDKLVIKTSADIYRFSIVDVSGKVVMSNRFEKNNFTIDVSTLQRGNYLLLLENETGVGRYSFVRN